LVGQPLQRVINIHSSNIVVYIRFQIVKTIPAEGVKEKPHDIYHEGK
jgi:hypothetical protein